jgi:hypothetical protein
MTPVTWHRIVVALVEIRDPGCSHSHFVKIIPINEMRKRRRRDPQNGIGRRSQIVEEPIAAQGIHRFHQRNLELKQ